jgi:hypothetical protein
MKASNFSIAVKLDSLAEDSESKPRQQKLFGMMLYQINSAKQMNSSPREKGMTRSLFIRCPSSLIKRSGLNVVGSHHCSGSM